MGLLPHNLVTNVFKNYKAMLGNSGKYCPVHKLQDIPDTDKNFINF